MTRSSDERTRRALLIGVDAYASRPLDGCVADARLMAQLLQDRFDFQPEHVRLLLDGDATRAAVLAELDALVDLTSENDIVFVFYAGHGSMIVDADGDEGSGFDNTLMVSDSPRQDIIDDELHARLAALGAKTPHTTLVFDACNSGTMARDAFATRGRSYPPVTRSTGTSTPSRAAGHRGAAARPTPMGAPASGDRYVLIAGCRDGEIANESAVTGDPDVHHGALTLALAHELERARSGATWRDVFERAAAEVTATHPAQHPQIEGAADRQLFGMRELPAISTVRVTDRATDTVALSTGAVFGATVGSTYGIFPAGTKQRSTARPLGMVEIVVVKGTASRARIVEERTPGAIVAGARAVEASHVYARDPLAVQLVAVGVDDGAFAPLREAMDSVAVVGEVRSAKAAAVRVLRLAPRDTVDRATPVPELGVFGSPRWAIVDRGGRLIAPVHPKGTVEDVITSLIRRASYEDALALDNADPNSSMRGAVRLDVLRKNATGAYEVAPVDGDHGLPVFDSGDAIAFRISSTLDEPVFVTLMDFDPLGAVSRMTKGNSNVLAPGRSFEIGTGSRALRLRWDGPDAVESFKLFAAVREVDFGFLERGDGTGRSVEAATPLGQDDWTTALRQILVRRKVPLAADGRAIAVDGASVTVHGLTGVIRSAPTDAAASRSASLERRPLLEAIGDAGMVEQQALVIADAESLPAGTRGDDAAPSVDLQVNDPGDGFAQVAMTVDDAGVVSWHFATEPDAGASARDADGTSAGTRTFHIPLRRSATAGGPDAATRGLASAIGQHLIKVYAFPLGRKLVGQLVSTYGEQLELQRTPYRVRTFLPVDYASPEATELDALRWQQLATGRALLMIHGTNSRTHTAFGGLPRDFVEAMHDQYEGRVFAFDHPTLTHTPRQNIEWLLQAIPEGLSLDVDIICHSRGGLVSRVLSEKLGELPVGTRALTVHKLIFVGTPNAGTRLADEACIGDYLDTATNLLDALPTNGVTDALGYLLTGVKLVATGLWSSLKGLQSMQPGGPFGAWLNSGVRVGDARYYALTSNYTPREPRLAALMADRLIDNVFQQAHNDMVVPTNGVYEANGSDYFPIADQLVLGADDGIAHTHFFQYPRSTAQIAAWLAS